MNLQFEVHSSQNKDPKQYTNVTEVCGYKINLYDGVYMM